MAVVPSEKRIRELLRATGEEVSEEVRRDVHSVERESASQSGSFTHTRIGVGEGFASLLYAVEVDGKRYAVKVGAATSSGTRGALCQITHPTPNPRAPGQERMLKTVHNRELAVYEWFTVRTTAQGEIVEMPLSFGEAEKVTCSEEHRSLTGVPEVERVFARPRLHRALLRWM